MPTDLPPDYRPKPSRNADDPADPAVPGSTQAYPPEQGADAQDPQSGTPSGSGGDVVDPTGWTAPPMPGEEGAVPLPAGMPTF